MRRKHLKCMLVVAAVAIVPLVMENTQTYSLMSLIVPKQKRSEHSERPVTLQTRTLQTRREKLCDKNQLYDEKITASGRGFQNFTLPKLLNNFRSPCFFMNTSITSQHNITTEVNRGQFRCMPYFLIAGFPKAGTTDLWNRLIQHPDILANHFKEPWIIHQHRHSYSTFEKAVKKYIEYFKSTAQAIGKLYKQFRTNHFVTGDGSCDTAHYNFKWQEWPGNEHCKEPVVTNADYVHQINPKMKIIFMIRDPTERLYSDYIYEARFYKYNTSVGDFHNSAVNAIEIFQRCAAQHSVRFCAYDTSLDTNKNHNTDINKGKRMKVCQIIRIRLGMYHIFIEDWLKVFGPNNTIIVHTESTLGQKRLDTYRAIIKFLDLRQLTRDEEAIFLKQSLSNARSEKEHKLGGMWNVTRKTLDDFFAPFTKQMSTFNIY